MSDVPTFERRGYAEDAVATTITADISATATSFNVADGSSYPAAAFWVIVDADTDSEDKVFVTTRNGDAFNNVKGLDFGHSTGAVVNHVIVAQDLDEANAFASTLTDKGGLITRGAAAGPQQLPRGTSGLPVVSDDAAPLGLSYKRLGAGALAALGVGKGGMYVGDADGDMTEVQIGDANQVWGVDATSPVGASWIDIGLGAWTDWTPVVSQSAASTAIGLTVTRARYTKIGRTVIANFDVTFTGTGTSGQAIFVSLPITAADGHALGGSVRYDDISTAPNENYIGVPQYSGDAVRFAVSSDRFAGLGANPTFAIAVGDTMNGVLIYEAAS